MTTTRAVVAFGRNDLKSLSRDSLMVMVLFGPFGYAAAVWFLPAMTRMAAQNWQFDLTPYHSLIISGFCVMGPAVLPGAILALQLLDEKDQHTLMVLRVTPLPRTFYPAYRATLMTIIVVVSTVAALAITGQVPGDVVLKSVAIGLVGGVLAVNLGLLMAGMSGNKIEGLAVMRVIGLFAFTVPLLPFFILDSPWQLAFGILPPYWPVRAFWAAWDGTTFWPYVLVGLVYNAAVALLLLRFAARRLG